MLALNPLYGDDAGILQTVGRIKDAIYYALREPDQRIRKRAEDIIRAAGIKERDELTEIRAIGGFVKHRFRFTFDPRGLEYVKSPETIDDEITRYNEFMGDCDDAAGYLAALLKSLGYRVNLTVIANPQNPRQNFSHIFVQVFSSKLKKWITLDMTAKKRPLGWTAPASRLRSYEV